MTPAPPPRPIVEFVVTGDEVMRGTIADTNTAQTAARLYPLGLDLRRTVVVGDRSEDIRTGDTIVTSGLDGIFPRGLLVGTIKYVHREGPGLFLNVSITPAVEFRGLEQVLIVTQPPPHIDDQVKG